MARHSCSLCQNCYELSRGWRYFPETDRDGDCCGCGDWTFVARVTKAEAAEIASDLYADPADRPHGNRDNARPPQLVPSLWPLV